MGMEKLNNAARAAGYAMATSDDLLNNSKPEAKPEVDSWRPGEAIMASQAKPSSGNALHSVTDWVKGRVLGVLGRGAPA
jgi:hypothetical protein